MYSSERWFATLSFSIVVTILLVVSFFFPVFCIISKHCWNTVFLIGCRHFHDFSFSMAHLKVIGCNKIFTSTRTISRCGDLEYSSHSREEWLFVDLGQTCTPLSLSGWVTSPCTDIKSIKNLPSSGRCTPLGIWQMFVKLFVCHYYISDL